jgi:mono/diheme cytochrome c family protein
MVFTPVPGVVLWCVYPVLLALELMSSVSASGGGEALDRAARLGPQPGESSSGTRFDVESDWALDQAIRPSATGPIRLAQASVRPPSSLGDGAMPAPAGLGREDRKPAAAVSPSSPIQVFRTSCLECHDSDGRGEIGRDSFPKIPNFTDPGWHSSRTDAQLSKSILDGKGKSMPRMRDKLGSVDVKQMVAFVRGFRGGKQVVDEEPPAADEPEHPPIAVSSHADTARSAAPTPAQRRDPGGGPGARLFQRLCAKCHSADGTGSGMRPNLPEIPDFTLHSWQSGRTSPQLTVSILDGKGTGMPAFRDRLSGDEARDLVAFVRAFDPMQGQPSSTTMDQFEARFRELEAEFESLRQQSRALSSSGPAARRGVPARPSQPFSEQDHR